MLGFTLPSQVREFFLLTAGINVSTGVILSLSGMFNLTIHGERYCVLGEFWKEADGDQLLLRPGEETCLLYTSLTTMANLTVPISLVTLKTMP